MDDAAPIFHSRKPWLPLLISLLLFAGLSSLVLWQWRALESSSRASQEQLFALPWMVSNSACASACGPTRWCCAAWPA